MQTLITIIVVVLQLFVGQVLGFGLALASGVGDGWELIIILLGNTAAVWGIGTLADWLRTRFVARPDWSRLLDTAVGSAIGVILVLITPPFGYVQVLLPLIGALVGYYFGERIVGRGRGVRQEEP